MNIIECTFEWDALYFLRVGRPVLPVYLFNGFFFLFLQPHSSHDAFLYYSDFPYPL
jgi:hypothetical protein